MTPHLHALASELARRHPTYEPIARELHAALHLAYHTQARNRPRQKDTSATDHIRHPTDALVEELRQALQAEQTCAVGKSAEIHACATRMLVAISQCEQSPPRRP
jgi:hypothetical protein